MKILDKDNLIDLGLRCSIELSDFSSRSLTGLENNDCRNIVEYIQTGSLCSAFVQPKIPCIVTVHKICNNRVHIGKDYEDSFIYGFCPCCMVKVDLEGV